MDQINEQFNPQQDNQLAEFADQVMQGKLNRPASSLTDELPGLKETILRLSNGFPPNPLDDAAIKQMHVRLKARIRREEKAARPSFWKKWFGRDVSPQLGLAFTILAVLIVFFVSTPSLTAPGSTTTGTASTPVNFIGAAVLAAVLFVVFWVTRRK